MRYFLAALVVAAPFNVVVASGAQAQAQDVTCQGKAATVVGPTEGFDTTGAEGDDVIVAPLGNQGAVLGLGGNDTICLIDGASAPSRDPIVKVDAGQGNDSVHNLRSFGWGSVELGAGADLYVGNDYPETVYGASSREPNGADTEVDVFDTHGGDDRITSGSGAPGVENEDVISTGTGRDTIIYRGAAGGAVDNGPDSDALFLSAAWPGDLTIDNRTRRASVGSQTALSWTAVDSFSTRVDPGSSVSFHGTNADEGLNVSSTVLDLAMPTQIVTGGCDDRVGLENYLPANVDLGDGYDTLTYLACHRAHVALAVSAECLTAGGAEVSTALAGVEYFPGSTADGLTVQGSDRAERISAVARYVLVYGGPGADRVFAFRGRITQVIGGRGDDRIKGVGRRGVILNGGRGADVLRGDGGPDQLHGDLGQDVAWGQRGKDECDAEVRHFCE